MKRKKYLRILGCLLFILCVIVVAEIGVNKHNEKINNTDQEILAVKPEDVVEAAWTYEDKKLNFKKTGDVWKNTDEDAFPVDQEKMEEFLEHFSSVKASFIIEDVEDYGQYNLTSPQCSLTLTTKEGENTINFGGYSTMDSQRYVSLEDGKVYLIEDDLLEYMTSDRDEFMKQDEMGGFDRLESFNMTGENTLSIIYDRESHSYTDDYLYYLVRGEEYKPLSTEETESFTSNVTDLELKDYVTYQAGAKELESYGIKDPVMTIEVKGIQYADEDSSGEDAAQEDADTVSSHTMKIGKKGNRYYANVDGSSIVYNLDDEVYDILKKEDYNDLRPREVLSLDWNKVSAVSFTVDDKEYTVNVDHKKTEDIYRSEGKELDFEEVTDAMDAMEIHEFLEEKSDKGRELSMVITLQKDNSAQVEELALEIDRYDGEDCLVTFNGECLGLMSRSLAVDLKEAVLSVMLGQEG